MIAFLAQDLNRVGLGSGDCPLSLGLWPVWLRPDADDHRGLCHRFDDSPIPLPDVRLRQPGLRIIGFFLFLIVRPGRHHRTRHSRTR
jgi:hypothetical protein